MPYVTVSFWRVYSRWRTPASVPPIGPGAAAAVAADEDQRIAEAYTASRIAIIDGIVLVVFWAFFLLFVRSLVFALELSDRGRLAAHHRSPFMLVEVFFCVLLGIFVFVTIAGMAATYNEHRFNGVGNRCLTMCGCCTNAYIDASAESSDIQTERNTHSAVALRKMYNERQPYQNNKLVWLCAPGVMPYGTINAIHILLLLLNIVALIVSAVLLFIRLQQIEQVRASLVGTTEAAVVVETLLAQTLSQPRFAAAGGWLSAEQWPAAVDLRNHVVYSLSDWRGKVMPLAVVFIPLFVAQSLLVAWALPQAIAYWLQPAAPSHWAQGTAYIAMLAMLLLFEALLSARVDDGTLAHSSWHNTFAPLYAGMLYAVLVIGLSIFCMPPARTKAAPSYCGLLVV